ARLTPPAPTDPVMVSLPALLPGGSCLHSPLSHSISSGWVVDMTRLVARQARVPATALPPRQSSHSPGRTRTPTRLTARTSRDPRPPPGPTRFTPPGRGTAGDRPGAEGRCGDPG